MAMSDKKKTGILVVITAVATKIADYIVDTIVRLNIEKAAEKIGADDELSENIGQLEALNMWFFSTALPTIQWLLDILTGPYGIGFVLGAVFVGFFDWIWMAATRPYSWFRSWMARRKTGLVPLVFKTDAGRTEAIMQDGKQVKLNHLPGDICGYEPPLASVLVQSGYADYYVFWDEWRHKSYQKLCRGMHFSKHELFPKQNNED